MPTTLVDKLREFDPNLPLAQAHTIPANWYFDEEIYRAEQQHVFGAAWQVAGLAQHVAAPGTYLTAQVGGEPVVVVRDEAGTLRALVNVCRHRAALIMNEPHGKLSKLRCRYHGWTYDLQGRLRGTPEFDGVEDFCKEENGLPEVAVAEWGGYVWVHLQEEPPQALAAFLAPLPERTRDLGLDRLRFFERREYMLECNWKVFVDNYQDGGYHVNTVHPRLADAIDYARYHNEFGEHVTVQISPFRMARDETVGRVRRGEAANYWWVFPNFMINLYSGVMDTHLVVPLGPDRCKVVMDWFFPPFASAEEEKWARDSLSVSYTVQDEDVTICEEVQRGLKSRTYHTGRFSVRREEPVYHFHRLLARYLRAGVGGTAH